jgi:hypothetical protein
MADIADTTESGEAESPAEGVLKGGAFEVLHNRLLGLNKDLQSRIEGLNLRRKEVFGGQESAIIGSDRIQTQNNCLPRDIVSIGRNVIFGYNVFVGMKREYAFSDVFSVHLFENGELRAGDPNAIEDTSFRGDFQELYKYYKNARFLQFIRSTGKLLMVFQTGETVQDFKAFRWEIRGSDLYYIDNRGDLDVRIPDQLEFSWDVTTRDDQIAGDHPHVSIKDRVFVETVKGDLTIKIENNTATGEGIYAEPVANADQTLDDASIAYAEVGHLILLRIVPYQEAPRYFIFDSKRRRAVREDTLAQACILLPEDHGIIFPRGCYLQDGEMKVFQDDVEGMIYRRCLRSPNGEDYAYIFYQPDAGRYIFIQYNLIAKSLANPIFCHGFTTFADGHVLLFSSPDDEPKRMHAMQIWQTPFYADTHVVVKDVHSFLNKIGNRDLVRGVSDCFAISRLIARDPSLQNFEDIISESSKLLDSYHWLDHKEVGNLQTVMADIRTAAVAAVDEYEKVVRIRQNTDQKIAENAKAVEGLAKKARLDTLTSVDEYVAVLNDLRARRGHTISLRELRFADSATLEAMEQSLEDAYAKVAMDCVDFLLRDGAFTVYHERVAEITMELESVEKIADLKPLDEELAEIGGRLDLLTDVVNNLNIEDTTKTTEIVDRITDVYGNVNRTKAIARGLRQNLGKGEASAEFAAQYKLLTQSITNFIGLCDTPARCDEFLTKVMITIEELEGRFADFADFIDQLTEKREEAYNAFNNRKQVLEEENQRRINALLTSANRILKGVGNRAASFKSIDEINAYYASDLMVVKLREIIDQLTDLGDTVKADDLSGQLKAGKDEVVRKLRDRLELFDGDGNIINLGGYKFSVNTQELGLTTVLRENDMYFHLTGTDYYELIDTPEFLATKALWKQEIVSESRQVYRAEYLAYQVLHAALHAEHGLSLEALSGEADLDAVVREFSESLYSEGYEKGVHDHDAARILGALVRLYSSCGLLRYDSECRAHAMLFWAYCPDKILKQRLRDKMHSLGILRKAFGEIEINRAYVEEIREPMAAFFEELGLPADSAILRHAAEFMYFELQDHGDLVLTMNALADDLQQRFVAHLGGQNVLAAFQKDLDSLKGHLKSQLHLTLDWLNTYVRLHESAEKVQPLVWEVAALILVSGNVDTEAETISTRADVSDLLGQHGLVENNTLAIDFDRWLLKLDRFANESVPTFRTFMRLRHELTEDKRETMRLSEFKPRVMGSFVRNKLINDVYLPMCGANFAKQMGTVGEDKRTDLMGLLLLISPPGYGKTTLMEYMANRLGLTFMKINGPAIGHHVGSLDPTEAPNATAREEVLKLNLALEMGNNVMIYLDDIQHCNPEFLQKFISLCDAQRKIEGVWQGRTRTYDLRGKKVCVVMAGNPYTESGEKFQIPDMLANRADTYNLGDVGGIHLDAFALSFVENAMTSNSTLSSLTTRPQADLYRFWEIACTGNSEGIDFDSDYGPEEANELVSVLERLRMVQKAVLTVNGEYIASAAQADDYRTEPPFKMQGSYRNMCRMAEKVYPVMTEAEIDQLILDHYQNESQTLTTGTEANMLKFKHMMTWESEEEATRWKEICREYNRRQMLSGADEQDKAAQIVNQLSGFNSNLDRLKESLDGKSVDLSEVVGAIQALQDKQQDLHPIVDALRDLASAAAKATTPATPMALPDSGIDDEDLAPIVAQLAAFSTGLGEIKAVLEAANAATPPENKIEFPAEYASAWSRQEEIQASLVPMLQTFEEQGKAFLEFRNLVQSLLSGKIQVEIKK